MRRLKIGILAVFILSVSSALIPAGVMATAGMTIGTVASVNLNVHGHMRSFIVSTPAGASVTVKVNANSQMVPMSAAAITAGFKAGDAVWADGGGGKYQFASEVKYDKAPFAITYAKRTFNGKVVSYTPPVSPGADGTLQIKSNAGKYLPFNTAAATKYFVNGKHVTSLRFKAGERVTVYGEEFTDGSWLALRADLVKK